ncbi:monovalent cation/H(+) antiporter subunit G [Stella sp.]|uniref:monovalent cation/H(+) antiporter subunit G n=1 Tax=Stella sp. TaxID=2912054 RepID=UPI0035B425B5
MAALLDLAAAACLLAGGIVIALAALGVVRFPDPFTRMHAATKSGVVGAGLLLLGAGLALGGVAPALTALAGLAFLVATTPIASHLLGRAAYVAGAPIAPATIADALEGVLDRRLFDIDPARRRRAERKPPPSSEEAAMTAIPFPEAAGRPAPQPTPLRRIVCWLSGAAAQPETSATALALARASGASLTALSLVQPAAEPRGPRPIGGSHWARWSAASRRERQRSAAAAALADFEDRARGAGVAATARHEEAGPAALARHVAAADLLVVPAGIDAAGERADGADELAARIATDHRVPVLRVARRSGPVRRIAILVDSAAASAGLAQSFARIGLWADAAVEVVPLGEVPAALDAAAAQAALLGAHGRSAELAAPLGDDCTIEEAATFLRRYDAVVAARLGSGSGWFQAVRTDCHAVAATTAALVLLP